MSIIKDIRSLFSEEREPFIGALGNKEHDAVAGLAVGINLDNMFLINPKSEIQQMHDGGKTISYCKIAEDIETYFPYYSYPKVGFDLN